MVLPLIFPLIPGKLLCWDACGTRGTHRAEGKSVDGEGSWSLDGMMEKKN